MQLYVQGKSKKEINERLEKGETVYGTEFSMFQQNTISLKDAPNGAVIKVFEKYVGGNPYAKSYGTWNKAKNKIA